MSDLADYSKMKVADLKKILKGQGLPVTGNKTELIDRLQASSTNGGKVIDSNNIGDEEEFDEEAILGDEEDIDLDKISPHEEESVLLGTNNTSMEKVKKKITLKRSEPILSAAAEDELPAEDETELENITDENSVPPNKKIKLADEPVQLEDKPDKISLKVADGNDERKAARLARFGAITSNNKISKGEPVDVDKLKKRAERFGEVTSTSLNKVEVTEKKKKRQERFGTESTDAKTISSTEPDEKKAARALRFATA